jgi:drug/metabolite transporter (DMT)-like permease
MNGQSVLDLPKDMRKVAILRGLFGGIAFMCSFACVKFIPISKSNILGCTSTLYIPFLARYFLNENFKTIDIVTLFFGFSGIILINEQKGDLTSAEFTQNFIGVTLGLMTGISGAFS